MSTVRHQLATGNYHLVLQPQLLNTNNDWSQVPSLVGYLGSGLTTTEGVDPRTLTAPDPSPVVSVTVNQNNPADVALGAQGGIVEFELAPNSTIGLGGSDTADAPYLVLYLDSTGRKQVEVSFFARDLEPTATSDSSATQFVVQYRTSTTGNWINAYYNADITRTPESGNAGIIPVTVVLPSDADNCPTLEVRLMTTNAVGNDEWVGIDDINVASINATVPPQGEFIINDIGNIVEGDAGITAAVFTVSRRGGTQGAVTVDYQFGTSDFPGFADTGDFQPGTAFSGTLSFADGELSKTVTLNVQGDTSVESDESFSVQLRNATGGAILAAGSERVGSAVILNDDPKPVVSIGDAMTAEGTGGTTTMTFVITRGGIGATANQAFDIDYATADGTAIAGLDYVATSGTLHFSAGQANATVTVTIYSDSLAEADESVLLNLSNMTVGSIVDGQGLGLIDNDDFSTQTGTPGADVMNGFGSDNILVGLAGNDTYFVDDDDDQVHEDPGEGNDAVYATANFGLDAGSSVEWLSTYANYAADPINLTGNDFGQYLIGNQGANILDGKGGADYMIGFAGDDTYYVDDAGDVVAGEGAGNGHDSIVTSVSLALAAGLEVEELHASTANDASLVLAGNEFAQILTGNGGANLLNGAGGADFMSGGTGSDTYFVDDAGDVVEEMISFLYTDVVYTSVSYALTASASVEWLSTIANYDTVAINLTGSSQGQYLLGNQGANVLDGKGGADVLVGYGGADSFVFSTAFGGGTGNIDVIFDYQPGVDRILLDDAIFAGIGGPGALAAGVFTTNTAGDANDRIIYNTSTGQLFYDNDGSGSHTPVHFATVQGAPVLTASDFQVI
jgi:Ca2+-binding RTX toxin-like protein